MLRDQVNAEVRAVGPPPVNSSRRSQSDHLSILISSNAGVSSRDPHEKFRESISHLYRIMPVRFTYAGKLFTCGFMGGNHLIVQLLFLLF